MGHYWISAPRLSHTSPLITDLFTGMETAFRSLWMLLRYGMVWGGWVGGGGGGGGGGGEGGGDW